MSSLIGSSYGGRFSPSSQIGSISDGGRSGRVRGLLPDRWQQAAFLASRGDIGLALENLYDPDVVSPAQQGEAEKVLFGHDPEEKGGWGVALKRIVTNPLAWLGIALMTKFPVGGKEELAKFLGESQKYDRYMNGISRFFSGANEVLKDSKGAQTRLGRLLENGAFEQAKYEGDLARNLSIGFDRFQRIEGRVPTKKEIFEVFAAAERWDDPRNKTWQLIRQNVGKDVGIKKLDLNEGQRALLAGWNTVREEVHSTLGGLRSNKALWQELQRKGMWHELPTKEGVPFYAPRMVHVGEDTIKNEILSLVNQGRMEEAMKLMTGGSSRAVSYMQWRRMNESEILPGNLKARFDVLVPSAEHLSVIEDRLKPGTVEAVRKLLDGGVKLPDGRRFAPYSLDLTKSASTYLKGVSRFKAWTLDGRTPQVNAEIARIEAVNPHLAVLAKDVFQPMVQGRLSRSQYVNALGWSSRKMDWLRTLDSVRKSSIGKAAAPVVEWMEKRILDEGSLYAKLGLGEATTGYLYLNSLGFNLSSAFNNALQTLGTTAPTIGYGNTLAGLKRATSKVAGYFKSRAGGLSHSEALMKAWPDLLAAGLDRQAGVSGEVFRGLEEAWANAGRTGLFQRAGKKFSIAAMAPFQAVEKMNWAIAFEGGMAAAEKAGFAREQSLEIARKIVAETQFKPGPLYAPTGIAQWPSWARMFLQFPMRQTALYANAVGRGRFGVPGRALVGAVVAKELGQQLFGVKVDQGLFWNGFPTPTEGRPFSPFPWVPPIVGTVGAVATDLAAGKFDQSRFALQSFIPGGIGLTRAASMINPDIARMTGRNYVRYDEPSPDGKYAMYTPTNQYIGHFTPQQIILTGMGFKVGDVVQEQEAMRYLTKQREIVRGLRQSGIEALMRNDMNGLRQATKEWSARFPNVPFPLKKQDIDAVEERKMMTRVQRVTESLPAELRGQFQGVASGVAAFRMPDLLNSPEMQSVENERDTDLRMGF